MAQRKHSSFASSDPGLESRWRLVCWRSQLSGSTILVNLLDVSALGKKCSRLCSHRMAKETHTIFFVLNIALVLRSSIAGVAGLFSIWSYCVEQFFTSWSIFRPTTSCPREDKALWCCFDRTQALLHQQQPSHHCSWAKSPDHPDIICKEAQNVNAVSFTTFELSEQSISASRMLYFSLSQSNRVYQLISAPWPKLIGKLVLRNS